MTPQKAMPAEWANNPKKIELAAQHQQWLQQQITQALLLHLQKEEERLVSSLCAVAEDGTKSDAMVRLWAVKLSSIRQQRKAIYDTEEYIKRVA